MGTPQTVAIKLEVVKTLWLFIGEVNIFAHLLCECLGNLTSLCSQRVGEGDLGYFCPFLLPQQADYMNCMVLHAIQRDAYRIRRTSS